MRRSPEEWFDALVEKFRVEERKSRKALEAEQARKVKAAAELRAAAEVSHTLFVVLG